MKSFLFFSILFYFPAKGQEILTLEEAIATALNNNYDIQLAKNDSVTNEESNNTSEQSNMGSLEGNTDEQSAKNDTVTKNQ